MSGSRVCGRKSWPGTSASWAEMPGQAQEARGRAESRLPLQNHRPLPAEGQKTHVLVGLAAPTEWGEAPGAWRGGCLATSAWCECQRPSNLRLHRGQQAEGPQGGRTRLGSATLLGDKAGAVAWSWSRENTDEGTKEGQECWAGTRSPGRQARLGGGMAPVASLSFLAQGMGRSGLGGGGLVLL